MVPKVKNELKGIIAITAVMIIIMMFNASASINLFGSDGGPGTGVNTTLGNNITEYTPISNGGGFLNFTLNDSAGNITWLNLTFGTDFALPLNTTANYSLTGFMGLDGTNVTVTVNSINVTNSTITNEIWNSTTASYFSINITNVSFAGVNGTFTINAATNRTPGGQLIYLTVDGAPSVDANTYDTVVSPKWWVNNGTALTLNATIIDSGSGVDSNAVYVILNGINDSNTATLSKQGVTDYWINTTVIVNTTAVGRVNLTINASDNFSQINTDVNFTVWVDNMAPALTNVSTVYPSGLGKANNSSTVILNLTASDSHSGLDLTSVEVNLSQINGSNWVQLNPAGNNNWTLSVVVVNSSTGTAYLPVRASDNMSNTNTSETFSVALDNSEPNVSTITTPTNGQVVTVNYVWVNGTTTYNDTTNVTVYVNGTATNVSEPVANNEYNISNVPLGMGDGSYYIEVSSTDEFGRTNTTNATVTVILDTTNPVINTISPNNSSKAYRQGGAQLYVNFTYTEANPKNYTVTINNSTAIINSSTSSNVGASPVSVSFTVNSTAAEGYYNVTVTMWDNASYTNSSTAYTSVLIDNTAPDYPAVVNHTDDAPSGYDDDTSVDLSWTAATDVLSSVSYTIYRDGVVNATTSGTSYTITGEVDGSHIYNVSASDAAGNTNATNASVTVIVDNTDPVIQNLSLSTTTPAYGEAVTVTVNATDVVSGINTITALGNALVHQSGNMWNGTITAGYGANNVSVIVTDNASNSITNTSLYYTGPAAPTRSGGGNGAGVGFSDEPENVDESIVLRIYLGAGGSATYNFDNVITSVEVTPERTYGLVAARVEILVGQPGSITIDLPNGILYKYVNVFVGTSGWAEGKLSNQVINFKVPSSWFDDNDIDPATVTLYRYHDGEWQSLETTPSGQADGYYQYSSSTPGFSTFMIMGQVKESADKGTIEPTATPKLTATPKPTATPVMLGETPEKPSGIPGFGAVLFTVVLLSLTCLLMRKRG